MALTKVTGEGVGDVDTLSIFKASTCEVLIGTDNAGTAQISFYENNTSTKEGLLKYDGNTNTVVLGTSGSATALAMARDTGAITVIGEGSATTSLQQGLAKCWHSMDGVGTVATFGSLNVASIHDSGTGNYGRTFTNPFSNDDYSSTTSASYASGGVKCGSMDSTDSASRNGGSTRYNNRTFNTGGSDTDANWINATCHGDLA